MSARLVGSLLALLLVPAATARANPPTLVATSIFGENGLVSLASNDIVVRVTTDAHTAFDGELVFDDEGFGTSSVRTRVPLRLGPSQTRELVVLVPGSDTGSGLSARLIERGRTVTTTYLNPGDRRYRTFVVLADPPRIRAAVDTIVAANTDTTAYIPPEEQVSAGVVGMERRSGDPRVPRSHFGWSGTALVVASAPTLERLDARGLDALDRFVVAGGSVVIFPADAEDVRGDAVRRLAGELSETPPRSVAPSPFLPRSVAPCRYVGPNVVRSEAWGVTAARGFGSVHVACFDGNAPQYAQDAATIGLLDALRLDQRAASAPMLPQGGAGSQHASGFGNEGQLSLLRRALDANEGARPVLPLVAIVFVIYVLIVGPLAFSWAEKKGKPTLALLTTPLCALACLSLFLVMGALAKGFTHRARSAAIVEGVPGERRAIERRITSLFFGSPMSPDLVADADGMVIPVRNGMSGHTTIDAHGERPVIERFRGGLWTTRLLRTDRMLDLGGTIETTFEGTRLLRVTNRTTLPLRGTTVIDARGTCFAVGDLAPSATKDVGATGTPCMAPGTYPYTLNASVLSPFAELLALDARAIRILNGLVSYAGLLTADDTITLVARLPPAPGIEGTIFRSEEELRLLRIVVPVTRAPLVALPKVSPGLEEAAEGAEAAVAEDAGLAAPDTDAGSAP